MGRMHNGKLLVKPDKAAEFLGTSGTIVAPDAAKKPPLKGVVVNAPEMIAQDFIGKRVHYPSYAAENYFDDDHIILDVSDIWMSEEEGSLVNEENQ